MKELERPLRNHLDDGDDEADLQRNWLAIQRRSAKREERAPWRIWQYCLVLGIAVAPMLWLSLRHSGYEGPLQLRQGASSLDLGSWQELRASNIDLSDGSHIALEDEARLEVLENSGSVFLTALRRGKASFAVEPNGPRRWVIECGLATVEVVGTAFSIQRTDERVVVVVEHGVVAVRGESLPNHHRRLTAGERLEVGAEPADALANEAKEEIDDGDAMSKVIVPSVVPAASTSSPPPRPDRPPAPLGSTTSTPSAADTVEHLVREAEGARRAGDRRRGADVLRRLLQVSRNDSQAAFSTFSMARWIMEEDPKGAAEALAALLEAGVPLGLEEDTRARLVEAWSRAHDHERAERAAADYERRFPDGSRLSEVRRWAAP